MDAGVISIRELDSEDDLGLLTDLLHRAYRPLLDMGLNYTATTQDVATT